MIGIERLVLLASGAAGHLIAIQTLASGFEEMRIRASLHMVLQLLEVLLLGLDLGLESLL